MKWIFLCKNLFLSFHITHSFRHSAQLCHRCAYDLSLYTSLYEEGKFCEAFHSKDEGWRDCESCGKARKRCLLAETKREESLGNLVTGIHREPQYLPQGISPELEQVVGKNSSILPLFEKLLSVSDADHERGHLILPKQGVEAYFPKISARNGSSIVIQDTEGKEWKFQFRYWISGGYRTYVLEGLKEFMVSKNWQPGDVVTFGRIEPGKKLVMGLRKARPC